MLPTFGLHRQGHVMGRVVFLPEGSQTLVHVDLLLLWLLLQSLCVSWWVTGKKPQNPPPKKGNQHSYNAAEGRFKRAGISVREGALAAVSALLFVLAERTLRRPCVVYVFTNSPQQNLPIGCPGLAKLPNSISFLWESDGLANWYSERRKSRRERR